MVPTPAPAFASPWVHGFPPGASFTVSAFRFTVHFTVPAAFPPLAPPSRGNLFLIFTVEITVESPSHRVFGTRKHSSIIIMKERFLALCLQFPGSPRNFREANAACLRRRSEEARRGWTRPRDESFGTDFTNKCRRLNVGMSQDGSLSLNHRLPARLPSTSACGCGCTFSSPPLVLLFLSASLRRQRLHLLRAHSERERERGPFELAAAAICHMPT